MRGASFGFIFEGVAGDSADRLAVHQHVGNYIVFVGRDGVGLFLAVGQLRYAGVGNGAVFTGRGRDGRKARADRDVDGFFVGLSGTDSRDDRCADRFRGDDSGERLRLRRRSQRC